MGSESEKDLGRVTLFLGRRVGGMLPGGLGGSRGAGVRGGMSGTPRSPTSVDGGRGGTGGVVTLGLGGGTGVSAGGYVPCSSSFMASIAPDVSLESLLALPLSPFALRTCHIAPNLLGEVESGDLASNMSISDVTLLRPKEAVEGGDREFLRLLLSTLLLPRKAALPRSKILERYSELLERFRSSIGFGRPFFSQEVGGRDFGGC